MASYSDFNPIPGRKRSVKQRPVQPPGIAHAGGYSAPADTAGMDPEMRKTLQMAPDTVETMPSDHPAVPHPFNLGRVIGNTFRRAMSGQLGARTQEANLAKRLAPIQAQITERKALNRGARYGRKVGI